MNLKYPMPSNRRYIHPAQKQLIITMSHSMTLKDIATATKISERTVQRVVRLWKQTGLVERKAMRTGRPRELDTTNIMVSKLLAVMVHMSE